MRVMSGAKREQRHVILLHQDLTLSFIEYALSILPLSHKHIGGSERIHNEDTRN